MAKARDSLGYLCEAGRGCFVEDSALRRQTYGARRALQHAHAQMRFELPDLMADRGRSDEQLFGRCLEAGSPGCRVEGAQGCQRREVRTGNDE